jgi:GT2 family glycosyltransferase
MGLAERPGAAPPAPGARRLAALDPPPAPARTGQPSGEWLLPAYTTDVSVIIVNYNAGEMLARTLESLYASSPRHTFEVIVVDNASRDGSVALVHQRFPAVRCVANPTNDGYTRANNQGMRLATGRYVFLLNNDTIVHPGAVDALVQYLDQHPHVGAAGSKVLNVDGTVQGTVKNHPTPMAALFGRHSVLTRLLPYNPVSRRYLVYLDQDFSRPFPAGSVSTCALMVRREAVQRTGPMDEGYFVYLSDDDWCRAIWAAGYEVHCVPDSVIVHDEHRGGSGSVRRPRVAAVLDFHKGAYRYYRKWSLPNPCPPWHPAQALRLMAAAGLAARAGLVLAVEYLRWWWQRWRLRAAGD